MYTTVSRRAVFAVLCMVVCLFPLAIQAQQLATAGISGTITDPSGSTVAGAVVTLTNVAQGTTRTFTTQRDGNFSFSTLAAARYSLSVAPLAGFAAFQQNLTLLVGQALNIPVHLQPAGSNTHVVVRGDTQQEVTQPLRLSAA